MLLNLLWIDFKRIPFHLRCTQHSFRCRLHFHGHRFLLSFGQTELCTDYRELVDQSKLLHNT